MLRTRLRKSLLENQRQILMLEASASRIERLEGRIATLEGLRVPNRPTPDLHSQASATLLGSAIVGASFLGTEAALLLQANAIAGLNRSLMIGAFTSLAVSAGAGALVVGLVLPHRWPRGFPRLFRLQVLALAVAVITAVIAATPTLH
jgi:hypothetical protein